MPAPERRTLLILGGTAEAAQLARAAVAEFGPYLTVITSLAGRTSSPAPVAGALRRGGFGGAAGLAAYLREAAIDLVIDATHPFAAQIARHARIAAAAANVPCLALLRPPWQTEPGDRWIDVPDMDEAARALARLGRRVLLTVGTRGLDAFAALEGTQFVVRLIEAPRAALPLRHAELVIARPPFTLDGERQLLHGRAIAAVVAKASGGARPAKLAAARELGLPVVMVARPAPEPGTSVASVAAAMAWIAVRLGLAAAVER
jgi:precorrin-6A/cobalt-precorrin-6A reductase